MGDALARFLWNPAAINTVSFSISISIFLVVLLVFIVVSPLDSPLVPGSVALGGVAGAALLHIAGSTFFPADLLLRSVAYLNTQF